VGQNNKMGFTFRKSIGKKNLRLNLSKSGATVSTGVKGLRVVNRHKGGARIYAQKSVAGVQLRYIKTVSPKKGAKSKKYNELSNKDVSQKHICSKCRKSIELDSRFCEHCGNKL
jgi:hypothetical protein